MKSLLNLASIFKDNPQIIDFKETFEEVTFNLSSSLWKTPTVEQLISAFDQLPIRDTINIHLFIDDVSIAYCSRNELLQELLSSLSRNKTDGELFLKFKITKHIANSILTLYSLDDILKYLSIYNNYELYYIFKRFKEPTIFHVQDVLEESFFSHNFIFTNNPANELPFPLDNRALILQKRLENCSFLNANEFIYLPEDFHLIKRSSNSSLNLIFENLCSLCSLTFISDISSVNQSSGNFSYNIKGYKTLSFESKKDRFPISHIEYYEIYRWIYSTNDINDRIGLARNVISLHITNNDPFLIDKGTLDSIKSNYNIYLKENVEKYISIKNKISEAILELSSKSSTIAKAHLATFKQTFLGLTTYFITVMLLNIKSGVLFTKETSWIAFCLILIALFLWWMSNKELFIDRKRFENQYNSLKERYKDLLDDNDLSKIFNNDENFKEDLSYIEERRKTVSYTWLFGLMFLVIIIKYFGIF